MIGLTVANENICDECYQEVVMDHRLGQIKCIHCGVIKEERFVDQTSEYRIFNDSNEDQVSKMRVGNSVNYNMDSQIDLIEIDDKNNRYNKRNYMTYNLQSNTDKNYTRALKEIKKYCDFLDLREGIPKLAEDQYLDIHDKPEVKGKKLETLIAALVYLAAKRKNVNVVRYSFEAVADCQVSKMKKAEKLIQKYIPRYNVPSDAYCKQFSNMLQLPPVMVEDMIKVCKYSEMYDIFENKLPQPRTIAASVILFFFTIPWRYQGVTKVEKTLHEIRETAGIKNENTIKKYMNILYEKKDQLLARALTEKADSIVKK